MKRIKSFWLSGRFFFALSFIGFWLSASTYVFASNHPFDRELYTINAGYYLNTHACSGVCVGSSHLWVDIAVKDLSYEKKVWIEWSSDQWATSHKAEGFYHGDLENGMQKWHVEIRYGSWGPNGKDIKAADIRFRTYARMNDRVFQDRLAKEYDVTSSVYPGKSARLIEPNNMTIGFGVDESDQLVLARDVEVFPFYGYSMQVDVLYSVDDWQTQNWVSANKLSPTHYNFTIKDLGNEILPEKLAYVVRYKVGEMEYWDHPLEYANNYSVKLEPRLNSIFSKSKRWLADEKRTVTNNESINFFFTTVLKESKIEYRIDDNPWVQTERSVLIPATDLKNGEHSLQIRVYFFDLIERTFSLPFTVNKTILIDEKVSITKPTGLSEYKFLTELVEFNKNGYLGIWNQEKQDKANVIARYASVEDVISGKIEMVYPKIPDFVVNAVVSDSNGNVYAAGVENHELISIYRFLADGTIDSTFGFNGRAVIFNPISGYHYEIYEPISRMKLSKSEKTIYFLRGRSYWNNKNSILFKIDFNGDVKQEVVLEGPRYFTNFLGLAVEGEKIWVKGTDDLLAFRDSELGLEKVSHIKLESRLKQPRSTRYEREASFMKTKSGDFWIADGDKIAVFTVEGDRTVLKGSLVNSHVPGDIGQFGTLIQLLPIGDNSVLAIGKYSNKAIIVKFPISDY